MKLLLVLLLLVFVIANNAEAQTNETAAITSSGSYLAAFRTRKHVDRSSHEVFHEVVTALAEYLAEKRVHIVSDPSRKLIETTDEISIESLLRITKDVGADHLLFLKVDRPITKWIKVTLQCFDLSGKLVWEESTSDGGGVSGRKGMNKSVAKLSEKLASRLGQAGLPLIKDLEPPSPSANE